MAITHEDMKEIKKELDERYVQQVDCDDIQREISKKFANDDKRIDLLSHRINVWNKLLWTIASTSIGALITSVLQLMLK